ncbi:hypothetical protein B0T21DRAFT_44728 [Apiosordaria backusii]|uniref:Uncharacterized protein n=1 Tax=Apiosordaria backusii TaxID=314023 RepID=A0AA40E0X8_9PEZI|nr:hypothetical protein B0T21DRAFT_44728 [Apiosordaria backusii]
MRHGGAPLKAFAMLQTAPHLRAWPTICPSFMLILAVIFSVLIRMSGMLHGPHDPSRYMVTILRYLVVGGVFVCQIFGLLCGAFGFQPNGAPCDNCSGA